MYSLAGPASISVAFSPYYHLLPPSHPHSCWPHILSFSPSRSLSLCLLPITGPPKGSLYVYASFRFALSSLACLPEGWPLDSPPYTTNDTTPHQRRRRYIKQEDACNGSAYLQGGRGGQPHRDERGHHATGDPVRPARVVHPDDGPEPSDQGRDQRGPHVVRRRHLSRPVQLPEPVQARCHVSVAGQDEQGDRRLQQGAGARAQL